MEGKRWLDGQHFQCKYIRIFCAAIPFDYLWPLFIFLFAFRAKLEGLWSLGIENGASKNTFGSWNRL